MGVVHKHAMRAGLKESNLNTFSLVYSNPLHYVHPKTCHYHTMNSTLNPTIGGSWQIQAEHPIFVFNWHCYKPCMHYCCFRDASVFVWVFIRKMRKVHSAQTLPTVQASVNHFNLPPPHVSEGTAFPETWRTEQGGVTSLDRIDNLPI